MRAIAESSDTTHPLVIYHFKSKEKLWYAVMENVVGEFVSTVLADLEDENGRSAAQLLRDFIESIVRFVANRPDMHRIITMAGTQETERGRWLIEKYTNSLYGRVLDLIQRGQREGTVRHLDPTLLYYNIIGTAGVVYTAANEIKVMTGRNMFSEAEIYQNIAFIMSIVFLDDAKFD